MTTARRDNTGRETKAVYRPHTVAEQLHTAVELFGVEDTAAAIEEMQEFKKRKGIDQ